MAKLFWYTFTVTIVFLLNLCESEKLQKERREKRQLFYRDITDRPRSFRSRADEKDETDRTGHLPLEDHYPSSAFAENYEGGLVDSVPHFPEGVSYDNKHHETKPSFSKPTIFSSQSYEAQHEASQYKPKPIHEEPHYKPKPIHEEPHNKPKPIHEEPHYKPKPIHEEPQYKPKPIHEEQHYKPKPIHDTSYYKPKPIHEAPYYKPKPIHEEQHYKPKPVYEAPIYKPKPVHVEPHYISRPVYEVENYKPAPTYDFPLPHDVKTRPHKIKNSIPGIAGKDYPIYNEVPYTSFSCDGVPHRPGMYANPEASCQAYHVCHDDRHGPQGASFLCTNGTLFNQEIFSCDWWYNVDCNKARSYYGLNSDPHHNPYSQNPYFEEQSHYSNDEIVHSGVYEPAFRESKPKDQYTQSINPIRSQSADSAPKVTLSIPTGPVQYPQTTKYKSSKEKVGKPVVSETKKAHFNIESNHGSFFTPFLFGNEEQEPTFSTKEENKIIQELYSEPMKRQTIIETKISRNIPKQEDKLKIKIPSKPVQIPLEKTSLSKPTNVQIQDPTDFPEFKDIYSRVVANQKRTKGSQFTKPQLSNRLQKDQTAPTIPVLKEEMRIDHSADDDLNFEWGEKI